MSYIGNKPNDTYFRTPYRYVAAAGQTTFSGADYNGITLSYTPNMLDVFVNGIALSPVDYTATDGSVITIAKSLSAGDEVYFIAHAKAGMSDTYTQAQIDGSFVNYNELHGFRNVLINGGFDIWQRGTSGFGHSAYSADRWVEYTNTNDGLSISQITFTPGQTNVPGNPLYCLRASLTAGTTGVQNDFRQYVEGVHTFAGKTVTLSYYIRGSINCVIPQRRVDQNFGSGGSATVQTPLPDLNVGTSWQKVTDTFTLPSIAGKTVGSGNLLDVVLGLPVNTTVIIDIANVQLEEGPVATPFERRSRGLELLLCQRYYEIIKIPSNTYAGQFSNGSFWGALIPYKVQKRISPSLNLSTVASYWTHVGVSAFSLSSTAGFSFAGDEYSCKLWQTRQVGNATPTVGNYYMWEAGFTVFAGAEL